MQPCVMVTGVPAVGKTSLTNHVSVLDTGVSVKNFGQVMFEIGRREQVLEKFEDLEAVEIETRTHLQAGAVKLIRSETALMPMVIDGHLVVETNSGFVPGLPLDCISQLQLTAIVLLTADATDIITRRNTNPDKYAMRIKDKDRINLHQKIFFQACLHYALLSHATFEIIVNPQNRLEDATQSFLRFLRTLAPQLTKK